MARLKTLLPGSAALEDGKDNIDRFNRGAVRYLLLNPKSAGHGLNRQKSGLCNRVIFSSTGFSHELCTQAIARVHRSGQKRTVFVHRLLVAGSIDMTVVKVLERKDAGQREMMEALRLDLEGVGKNLAALL